ncbi:MAG: YceI family protein [Myxococcota bacterium]
MRTLVLASALLLTPIAASAAPAGTYTFDESHTFVLFKIGRANASPAFGMLPGSSGTFVYNPAKPGDMKVDLTLPVDAIYTANKKRDGHLKSPDFFNAKQFPKVTFKTSKVTVSGDTYKVTGKLNMHGKSKTETFTLKKIGEGKNQQGKDYVSFEGTMTINRKDYGISYLDGYLSDSVEITVAADGLK